MVTVSCLVTFWTQVRLVQQSLLQSPLCGVRPLAGGSAACAEPMRNVDLNTIPVCG